MRFRSWQAIGSISMTGGKLKQPSTPSPTTSCMSMALTYILCMSALKKLMPFRSSSHMAGLALFWRHSISSNSSPLHVSKFLPVLAFCTRPFLALTMPMVHAMTSSIGTYANLDCGFMMCKAESSSDGSLVLL